MPASIDSLFDRLLRWLNPARALVVSASEPLPLSSPPAVCDPTAQPVPPQVAFASRVHPEILQGLSEGVLVFSTGGRLVYWNAAAETLLGRSFTYLAAPDSWVTLRPDGSRMPVREMPAARVFVTGEPQREQLVGDISPSGVLRWLSVNAQLLPPSPEGPRVLVSFTDLSERRRAEQEVRRYRERLEALVEIRTHEAEEAQRRFANFIHSAPVPICVFGNDGLLTIANQRFWDTFGFRPEQIPGLAEWWQLAYPEPDYRREVARMWLSMQRERALSGPRATAEQRVHCSDGRVLTMEISAVTLEDGYLATFVDVSSRHESAARVREIAELNLSLIESSTQGMALYRHDGTCLLANEAAASLLGQPRSMLLQTNLHAMTVWRNTGLRGAAEQALATMQSQRLECEVPHARTATRWIAIHLMPFNMQAERRLLLMFDDITAYRTEEFRLREDKRVAEEANKVKSTFLASMSHEIRNPLNAIMGMAEVLKDDRLDPDQRRVLDTISAAGHSLLGLVNDVLDFAKIEAGRLEVEPMVFSVPSLLDDLIAVWRASAEQKGLSLLLTPLPPLPEHLLGDAQRVLQILTNFLSNAIKFTAVGKVCVGVDAPTITPNGLRLRFHVSDTGSGIPAEELDRVFDPFTQLEDATTVRNSGTGLGLAICRELAALLDGRVGATSQPGSGSTFWLEVPLQVVAMSAAHPRVITPALSGDSLAGLQVLIVDDSPVNLEVAARLLAREGANVRTAASGDQALSILQGPAWPDLLLLDVQMPGMDGLDLARRIRAQPRGERLALLALSAGTLPVQREAAREAGMDDFIAKPFELHDMVTSIRRALQLRDHPAVQAAGATTMDRQATAEWDATLALARASRFPVFSGHDLVLAYRRMGGDSALYIRSLRLFDAELLRAMDAIREHARAAELEMLRRAIHRLKGASGMVACSEVHRLANRLEEAFDGLGQDATGIPQRIREHLVQLQGCCARQRATLQASLLMQEVTQAASAQAATQRVAMLAEGQPQGGASRRMDDPSWQGMAPLSEDCKESIRSLLSALERRELQALELFAALPQPEQGGLSHSDRYRIRQELDRLAFDEAARQLAALLESP